MWEVSVALLCAAELAVLAFAAATLLQATLECALRRPPCGRDRAKIVNGARTLQPAAAGSEQSGERRARKRARGLRQLRAPPTYGI